MTALCVAACVAGVVAQVAGERMGDARGRLVGKPLASASFLVFAMHVGVTSWAAWWALLLCFVGDMALLGQDRRAVAAGLTAFLAGHVGWLAVLMGRRPELSHLAVANLAVAVPAAFAWDYILPHTGRLKPAVGVYLVVVTAMAGAALALTPSAPWVAAAGLAFWLSDAAVARQRFLAQDWRNRAVGLPLYYAAMFGLVVAAR